MISILFTQQNSIYQLLGQDCWNIEKNALRWPGGNPIICHPPCRTWGKFKWASKPTPGEKNLAIWSIHKIRLWGGILEHPSTSTLWQELDLPLPGSTDKWGGWTLNIDQHWFGHRAKKNTHLYLVGIKPKQIPEYPICLNKPPGRIEYMGKKERESTPIKFAQWLIETAKIIYENTQMDFNKRVLQ